MFVGICIRENKNGIVERDTIDNRGPVLESTRVSDNIAFIGVLDDNILEDSRTGLHIFLGESYGTEESSHEISLDQAASRVNGQESVAVSAK